METNKDYIENIEGAERRYFFTPVTVEKRAEENAEQELYTIEGYAAVFNKRADLFWFEEEILPGAFDEVLNDDVRCLFNHNPNYILARSVDGKGTLTLSVDSKGLKYSYVTPKRGYAIDLQDAIETGDVSQSSFAFRASEVIWKDAQNDDEKDLRQIKKIAQIYDVSPVTYPAYHDAEVGKRSYDQHKEQRKKDENKSGDNTSDKEKRASSLDVFEAQYLYNQNSKR
ncbi:HK97 family phage prohead protease [Zunongwangia profunda]|uniref:HK97 family phage prohead protease n=1 Tax=Zunongwangia profunda TaxID=398743 RepID=UPI00248F1A86|nr:HK97 family phage prohead protease [Zunongwangia profunda]|tara:strand:- start:13087 stop:13767 length:681 start_codon:yes stop_codon:yes gene_type:complete